MRRTLRNCEEHAGPNHARLPAERTAMAIRRTTLTLAAALLLALALGAERASAATLLGSVDPSASPEAFACAVYACPAGKSVGFRQLALHRSDVVVSEPGVLVSARVNAKRIAGAEQPRIAVLRPVDEDDIGVTIAGFAPLPVVSQGAEVHEVGDLHLPVEAGDAIGFLLPVGPGRPRPEDAPATRRRGPVVRGAMRALPHGRRDRPRAPGRGQGRAGRGRGLAG